MKTIRFILVTILLLCSINLLPQEQPSNKGNATVEANEDSIIIRKGKNNLHIKIYEEQESNGELENKEIYDGVFLETINTDKNTFLDILPFIPKKNRKHYYHPHTSGINIGFSVLTDNFAKFNISPKSHLDMSKSGDIGISVLTFHHAFKRNPHWGINLGMSWGYRFFSFDGDYALVKENGEVKFKDGKSQQNESEGQSYTPYYSDSWMRHFYFRIPIQIEWQQRFSTMNTKLIFFNIGPEFELRHGIKSFTHILDGKKKTIGKGLYVLPVGVNLLFQTGFDHFGFYVRYSMTDMFQKNKGLDLYPYSFGISFFW